MRAPLRALMRAGHARPRVAARRLLLGRSAAVGRRRRRCCHRRGGLAAAAPPCARRREAACRAATLGTSGWRWAEFGAANVISTRAALPRAVSPTLPRAACVSLKPAPEPPGPMEASLQCGRCITAPPPVNSAMSCASRRNSAKSRGSTPSRLNASVWLGHCRSAFIVPIRRRSRAAHAPLMCRSRAARVPGASEHTSKGVVGST